MIHELAINELKKIYLHWNSHIDHCTKCGEKKKENSVLTNKCEQVKRSIRLLENSDKNTQLFNELSKQVDPENYDIINQIRENLTQ